MKKLIFFLIILSSIIINCQIVNNESIYVMIDYAQQKSAVKKDTLFHGWERYGYEKDIIYIEFKENDGTHERFRGVKFYNKKEKGTVFNPLKEGSLLFKNTSKSDTLILWQLKNYKITTTEEVEEKIKNFRRNTYRKLPLKNTDKTYQFYHRNDLFITYLIEVLREENKFVIYPVIWRNQGEREINTRFD